MIVAGASTQVSTEPPASLASGSLLPVKHIQEPPRRHRAVGVNHQFPDLIPVEFNVQPHAEPTTMAHIRRAKETLRVPGNQELLRPGRCGTPERQYIIMMMVGIHHECLLVAYEPGRFAMAEALGSLGKGEAERA